MTRVIKAGTELHRISSSKSKHSPNSFNHAEPLSLDDEFQGRFEPTDRSHGGYLYVAESITGAVAEGILRRSRLPAGGFVRRTLLADKAHTVMVLERDVEVAVLMDGGLPILGLTSAISSCFEEDYAWSRTTCHRILDVAADTDGVVYRCRHNAAETALMLLDRHELDSSALRIVSSCDILTDRGTREQVLKVLKETFGLQYAGAGGARRV